MIFNVVLERVPQLGLGLAIKRGFPGDWAGYGAHILDILPNSPAYGKLRPGDVVMAINGVSLEHRSYADTLAALRDAGDLATLLVFRRTEQEEQEIEPEIVASTNSLFLPDIPKTNMQFRKPHTREMLHRQNQRQQPPRRTFSMPGFVPPNQTGTRVNACSSYPYLPQPRERLEEREEEAAREEMERSEYFSDTNSEIRRRQASLLKINLAKKHASDALGVELSGQLVITSISPGSKAESAGLRTGDRVVNLNGIDSAHLSLIDAAYMLRREHSDVMLMRVQHPAADREEAVPELNTVHLEHSPHSLQLPFQSPTRLYENIRQLGEVAYQPTYADTIDAAFSRFDAQSGPYHQPGENGCRLPQDHYLDEATFFMTPNLRPVFTETNQISTASHCTNCHANLAVCSICKNSRQPTTPNLSGQYCSIDLPLKRKEEKEEDCRSPRRLKPTPTRNGGWVGQESQLFTIPRHPLMGTGLKIIGGNAVGIFISEVNPQSPAANMGVIAGDEIVAINGKLVSGLTKSEAAQLILEAQSTPLRLELRPNLTQFQAFIADQLGPGDNFFVRTAFQLLPPAMDQLEPCISMPALPIAFGDIFHVTDTLLSGSFSAWLARKVSPTVSPTGCIPSFEKALQLLKSESQSTPIHELLNFRSETADRKSLNLPYLRVVRIDGFPYPRPIVIYGPLSERAQQLLVLEESSSCGKDDNNDNLNEAGIKFEIPPIIGKLPFSTNSMTDFGSQSLGAIRLSAIQMVMEKKRHPIVDLRPSSVETLVQTGIPSIVLLITANSLQQIRLTLEQLKPQQSTTTTKEEARRLWMEIINLRQAIPHLITDTIPLISGSGLNEAHFDEEAWIQNLVSVIQYQQKQPKWSLTVELSHQLTVFDGSKEDCKAFTVHERLLAPKPPVICKKAPLCSTTTAAVSPQVWVAENSVMVQNVLLKKEELDDGRILTPSASSKSLQMQTKDGDASEDVDTGLSSELRQPVCSLEKALDCWSALSHMELVNDLSSISDVVSLRQNANEQVRMHRDDKGVELRCLVIQSPRTVFTETHSSQTDQTGEEKNKDRDEKSKKEEVATLQHLETCIDDVVSETETMLALTDSPDDVEYDNMKLYALRKPKHKPLSGRNLPRGLISSPRRVVAEVMDEFDSRGGRLELADFGLELIIPPGALQDDQEAGTKQEIYLRVYEGDQGLNDVRKMENTIKPHLVSPIVMCGPRGVRFLRPVTLTMPRFHTHNRPMGRGNRALQQEQPWTLSVIHAATQSDGATSSSENEGTRRWHQAQLEEHKCVRYASEEEEEEEEKDVAQARSHCLGMESDSSGTGVTCQIADSIISVLIDHF